MKKLLILLTFASANVFAQQRNCPNVYATSYMDCTTGLIQLNATPGFIGYSWSPATGLSNPNIPNPTTSTPGNYTVTASALGAELVVNGDFSLGNTGFISGQTYAPVYANCNYFVGPGWFSPVLNMAYHDTTATADNMFMSVDGCTSSTVLWEETMNVTSATAYAFSFFATEAHLIQPIYEIHFIGNVTGDNIISTQNGIPYTAAKGWAWDQYGVPLWNSGANTVVTIRITNLETNGQGNDFGMDDFSFRKIICTSSYTVNATAPLGMNLFTNGDFSAGNTGFTSGHTYFPLYAPCNYYVGPGWFSPILNMAYNDHTPSTDNMFMSIDGCSPATVLWEETINIQPNTIYQFEFWASQADYVQPIFEIHFIGNVSGDIIVGTQIGAAYSPTTGWLWDPYGIPCWKSNQDSIVTVRIVNLETNPTGDDFAMDDFSFRQCCNPDECCNQLYGRLAKPNSNAGTQVNQPTIFPNPSNGQFQIQFKESVVNAQASLFNLLGEQVAVFTINGSSYNFTPNDQLKAGVYVLRIMHNGESFSQRIVIQ
jgi:Secretion system C-terminal sorting domain